MVDLDAIEAEIKSKLSWAESKSGLSDFEACVAPEELVGECQRSLNMVAELRRLRQFVRDSVSTCYLCETCGHARTTKECVWCERDRLRDYAQNVAKWEAELILSQEAWGGGTREFPQFTAALYDRWLELQAQRNAALETDRGSRETRTGGTQ